MRCANRIILLMLPLLLISCAISAAQPPAIAPTSAPLEVAATPSETAAMQAAPPGAADVYKAYRAAFQRPLADQMLEPAARSSIDYYWFFRAIDRALQGKKLEGELAEAQQLTEQLMSCLREGTDGNTCALRVDADYQGWRSMSGNNYVRCGPR